MFFSLYYYSISNITELLNKPHYVIFLFGLFAQKEND